MLAQHYVHRLPSDYPVDRIRERIATRAPLWQATPGLAFKAFVLAERGRRGATHNAYASFYLWLDPSAAVDFLTDDRFASVIGQFGRPAVESLLPLTVRLADASEARVMSRQDVTLPPSADSAATLDAEAAWADARSAEGGSAAVIVALDTATWRLVRLVLARDAVEMPDAVHYDVAYLAHPGWALPKKEA